MNAEERRLISDLFARLRGTDVGYRDPDAEAFIRSEVSSIPHAPYAMTQTLVVQNQALEQAQARIAELERQLERQQAEPARGGFGGGYEQPGASPWGPRASEAMGAPAGGASANRFGVPNTGGYGQQPGAPFGQQAAPSRGGGFLSGALQTAAGVAGGALLFSGISSLFGGGQAEAAASEAAKAAEPQADAGAQDANVQDANADGGDGGWFSGLLGGGGDDGGDAGGDDGDWA
ncbi:hypothetical protein GCM10008171_20730 [Methylopila jiangsuensis]|uniref:DUF2076 domain-containing protein n=1 Tax=Methylopila jiangsuensis TaxID=586230 RepID=A0A9W6JJC9_9HYPH|nr:DUF2076 domain-containing protein [Methylopila jiangsuensis]MDR6286834.1 hypothetical protein [Methylopila jiangsuensis]GLK76819.1 hypothetical protein GCM10008171_20730 [Methylopila jiangsuensis]